LALDAQTGAASSKAETLPNRGAPSRFTSLPERDISQRFYGAVMTKFMAVKHGDFSVLTYKKKETKN
jgi:hypothetical protein